MQVAKACSKLLRYSQLSVSLWNASKLSWGLGICGSAVRQFYERSWEMVSHCPCFLSQSEDNIIPKINSVFKRDQRLEEACGGSKRWILKWILNDNWPTEVSRIILQCANLNLFLLTVPLVQHKANSTQANYSSALHQLDRALIMVTQIGISTNLKLLLEVEM